MESILKEKSKLNWLVFLLPAMRRIKQYMGTYLFLILVHLSFLNIIQAGEVGKIPEEAPCIIRSSQGDTTPVEVGAWRKYEGKTYYFCCQKCKEQFDDNPTAYLPPIIPRPAPDFVVENLKGKDITLKNYKGKVVLIDFWATWCIPCVEMMPELQKLNEKHKKSKKFVVLGISIDQGKDIRKKIKNFIKEKNISYPILHDAKKDSAFKSFNLKVVPTMFLINTEKQIVAQWTGKTNHQEVEKHVSNLLNKK